MKAAFRVVIGILLISTTLFFADVQPVDAVALANISTFAGTGTAGTTGNGGAATAAKLNYPGTIAFGPNGNLYIVQNGDGEVRMITPAGIISTVAGNGTNGYTGDGGPATSAELNQANGIAFDSIGNMYIGDFSNSVVRKVDTGGVISTFAGTGVAGSTGDGGAATSAKLNAPSSVAVDSSDNVYITDSNSHRIRKVTPAGIISTYMGNGTASSTGDGGASTAATINNPIDAQFDANGNLYVAEGTGHRVRKVTPAGIVSTFAGTGTAGFSGDGAAATAAKISGPNAVSFDGDGNVYIADTNNHRIRKVNTSGIISTITGTGTGSSTGDGAAATSATVNTPDGIAVDAAGNVYVAENAAHKIRKIAASTFTAMSYAVDTATAASSGTKYTWNFRPATSATVSRVSMGMPTGTDCVGTKYMTVPGSSGNYASTPNSTANSITGSIDLRAKVALDNWSAATQALVSKWDATSSNRSYVMSMDGGNLHFIYSNNGTSYSDIPSTTTVSATAGSTLWVRATFQPNNGSSGKTANFYTSSDGITWTALGSPVTTGTTTTIYNSSAPVEIGSISIGTANIMAGKVYYAEVRNGVGGTTVNTFDPSQLVPDGTSKSWTGVTNEVWTVNRSGYGLPTDVICDLTVNTNTNITAGTGSYRLLDQRAVYKVTTPATLGTGSTVVLAMTGFVNTRYPASYSSVITSYDNSATPISVDAGTTATLAITGALYNASEVIGQYDVSNNQLFTAGSPNNSSGSYSAYGYNTPTGVALDATNHRLFVSDQANNRVLIHTLDVNNRMIDRIADYSLGSSTPSVVGSGAADATGLSGQEGLCFDSTNNRLFVNDYGHARVLMFDLSGGITNNMAASLEIGQTNMTTVTTAGSQTQKRVNQGFGMAMDVSGQRIFVPDANYDRVMVFNVNPATFTTNYPNAVQVIGQSSYTTGTLNGLSQTLLDAPGHPVYDSVHNRLFVSDGNNDRVMVFDGTNASSGPSAINVLGQTSFTSYATGVDDNIFGNNGTTGLAYDSVNDKLFVSDLVNDRVMEFDTNYITNGEPAIRVFGQNSFTSATLNSTTQSQVKFVSNLYYDSSTERLYVSDESNHRVLIFDINDEITTTSLPAGTTGVAYSQSVTSSNPNGTAVYSVVSGSLPTGLSLSSAGAITGTPTAAGTYNFTVGVSAFAAIHGTLSGSEAYSVTIAGPSLNQASYRFFANNDAVTVGSALAGLNTAATAPAQGTPFRLRVAMDVSAAQLNSGALNFKLQYAAMSGSCDTAFSGETYGDLSTSSGAIRWYNNPTPASGATATTNANDPTYSAHTKVMQSYAENNVFTSVANIPSGQLGVFDFSLVDFSATASTSYCFRIQQSDGTAMDTYTQIPQITTAVGNQTPNAPTNLQQFKTNGTTPIPGTSMYDFQSSIGSWHNGGQANVAVTQSATQARSGTNSMRMALTSGKVGAGIYEGTTSRDLSANGAVFSAWVYLPASNTGTGWYSRISVEDNASVVTDGANVTLVANAWNLVTVTVPPSSLTQVKQVTFYTEAAGGGTSGTNYIYYDDIGQGAGIWTDENTVTFSGTVSDPDASDTLKLCVEVKAIGTAFTGTGATCTTTGVGYSGTPVTATVQIGSLVDGTQYHWQAWTQDAATATSTTAAYGGNKDTVTASPDFGVDLTAPSGGSAKDGASQGVDVNYNNGALDTLSGNWTGFSDASSGVVRYEYSIGTSAGGTTVTGGWLPLSTSTTNITKASLSLQTSQRYYFNVRAVDAVGRTSTTYSSDGENVAPTLTFSVSGGPITFARPTVANSYAPPAQSLTVNVSTNANQGYVVRQWGSMLNGATPIPSYNQTYPTTAAWNGSGFGYTSNDTAIQSSGNIFATGSNYTALASSGPGNIVADNTSTISGSVANDSYLLTYRLAVPSNQKAGTYTGSIVLNCQAIF